MKKTILKRKICFVFFFDSVIKKSFVVYSLSCKEINLLKEVDVFKIPLQKEVPFLIPKKPQTFLPYPYNSSKYFQLIEKYYPKTLLKVKQNLYVLDNQYKTVFVFDPNKILVFIFFCIFSMLFYELLKKTLLKDTLKKKLLKEAGLGLQKEFLSKLRKDFFQKFLENLKEFLDTPIGSKVKEFLKKKQLQKVSLLVLKDFLSLNSVFFNEYVFMDKIKEHYEENTFTVSCKHYFLEIKKKDLVILTRDFPSLGLFAGTKGIVDRVLLHQELEVTFFTTTNLPGGIPKLILSRYQTSLVKQSDIFL